MTHVMTSDDCPSDNFWNREKTLGFGGGSRNCFGLSCVSLSVTQVSGYKAFVKGVQ